MYVTTKLLLQNQKPLSDTICTISNVSMDYACSTEYMCSVSMTSLYMCYSVHVLSLHDCGLFIIHVLQCTCAQSPWLCVIHYTCATVYMCSVSMALCYSLYMCYSVHVLSLHGSMLFIIRVLQCTCAQSPWLFYSLYCVHVLQCTFNYV